MAKSPPPIAVKSEPNPASKRDQVRTIVMALHDSVLLTGDLAETLANYIAVELSQNRHPPAVIVRAYQEAILKANGPPGPYAQAILDSWARTGPPEPQPTGQGRRQGGAYGPARSSFGGSGGIPALSGRAIDLGPKKIFDIQTGETYYVDRSSGERLADPPQ